MIQHGDLTLHVDGRSDINTGIYKHNRLYKTMRLNRTVNARSRYARLFGQKPSCIIIIDHYQPSLIIILIKNCRYEPWSIILNRLWTINGHHDSTMIRCNHDISQPWYKQPWLTIITPIIQAALVIHHDHSWVSTLASASAEPSAEAGLVRLDYPGNWPSAWQDWKRLVDQAVDQAV